MLDIDTAFGEVVANGLCAALYLFTPLWAPQLVFGSPNLEAKKSQDDSTSSTFSLLDGLILFIYLALGNSALLLLQGERDEDETAFSLFAACVNLLAVLTWFKCQRFLNSWLIKRPRSRIVMQLLLYPLSVLLVAEIVVSAFMLVLGLQLFEAGFQEGFRSYIRHPLVIAAATVFGSSLGVVYLLRSWFRHLIAPKPLDLSARISTDHDPA